MKLFSTALSLITSFLFVLHAVETTHAESFVWVTENENPGLFSKVKQAFALELQPDSPDKVRPIVPYSFKYIARVGVFMSSCLILIGHREKEGDPPNDWFRAFSYDLEGGNKSEIRTDVVFWKWTFLTFASFEPSPAPDIVFKYYNCLECEAVELLSSFRYDMQLRKWELRIWPDNDPHIMIDSAYQFGDEDNWVYDCLYKITDITGDGLEDLVVRCRRVGEETKVVKDEILLYSISKGIPKRTSVTKEATFNRINKILCEGNKGSPLCK